MTESDKPVKNSGVFIFISCLVLGNEKNTVFFFEFNIHTDITHMIMMYEHLCKIVLLNRRQYDI